ncbi:MAG TPA: SLBB domain-containing protein [Planctomycetota bacterium]|nr:SLBB domain-containing protein [Planctomycetota bacterium]
MILARLVVVAGEASSPFESGLDAGTPGSGMDPLAEQRARALQAMAEARGDASATQLQPGDAQAIEAATADDPAAAQRMADEIARDGAKADGKQPNAQTADGEQGQREKPATDPAELLATWSRRTTTLPPIGASLWRRPPGPRPIASDYRLQPGDLVRVVVWGGAKVNLLVPVDNTGNLGVPEFGPVPVGGLTQSEAQVRVAELVRSFFKNAGAVVAVERARAQAVTVVGEVVSAGYHSLPAGGTVIEALAAAGGPLPLGSVRAIRVSRAGQDDQILDLYRLLLEGDGALLAPLPAGSVVFVPQSGPQVQVFGAVRRPALVELRSGESLAEALRLAGGPESFADADTVRLLREDDAGQTLVHVTIAALADLPARAGDRLLIDVRASLAQGRGTVAVNGAVRSAGSYAFAAGMTAGDAIAAAGGQLPEADFARAIIRRHLAEPRQLELADGVTVPVYDDLVPLVDLDTALQPLDELVVPTVAALDEQLLTVSIQGEVMRPGVQPLVPDMTVRDLVRLAGGVKPQAEIDVADLVRNTVDEQGNRSVERARIDLKAVLLGDPGPTLGSGDTLVVRRRADERVTVQLIGEVRNAGEFTVPAGTSLSAIIALAGGLTERAFPEGAALYRESEKAAAIEHLKDLAQRLEGAVSVNKRQLADAPLDADRAGLQATIVNQEAELVRIRTAQATGRLAGLHFADLIVGKANDLQLHGGDVLHVPTRPGTVRVLGEVMSPGSIRYEGAVRPTAMIQRSGGLTRHADEDRIYVVRADGTVVASANGHGTSWSSDERRYVRTSFRSLDLKEGDTVIVPPDLRYKESGMRVAKDITQILFQVAAATGTVALLAE